MKFDNVSSLAPSLALAPAAAIADDTPQVTTICDVQGLLAVSLLILTGALADADAAFSVLMEEGDKADLSDAVAVPDAALVGTEADAGFTFADDNGFRKIGYVGSKRYIRATITPANNSGDAFIAAAWIGCPEDKPAANPPGS